jgi:sugar O-acyltransferase (sialic acid O-acetyltransferase NeuD family)
MRVVIIGAGGHGKEVADILNHQARVTKELSVWGFVDDRQTMHGSMVDGLPVLGDWRWFEGVDRREVAVICAVGTPQVCLQLVQKAKELDLAFASAISPLALISPHAKLGEGVTIFPHAIVNTGACINSHTILNVGATVSHDTVVGSYANINPGVHLAGNVTVGEGCYIGMGANVIQGRTIGNWSVIGAGAVVVRDIPSSVTAVGVPAKIIKTRDSVPQ